MTTNPIRISDSLTGVVRSLRGPVQTTVPTVALGGVFGRWSEIVGEPVAAHVQPVKLDGDRLIVEVDDPAWATQLKFLEDALRVRLLDVAGAAITKFEIRVKRR
jgi:predicted nucleic acid-binding Zn ribbon protein